VHKYPVKFQCVSTILTNLVMDTKKIIKEGDGKRLEGGDYVSLKLEIYRYISEEKKELYVR
jgi:hypothetical protein